MKWLLRQFNYTRQLERRVRELTQESHALDLITDMQSEIINEYQEMETQFTRLTLDEAHDLFSACVDYQRALYMLSSADPIQNRILPIMEKYNITIERNTNADDVTNEALKRIAAEMEFHAGDSSANSN